MQDAYATQLASFLTWMLDANMDPDIMSYFSKALTDKTLPTTDLSPAIDSAVQDQNQISWDNLLFGRMATKWIDLQQEHYCVTGFRCLVVVLHKNAM